MQKKHLLASLSLLLGLTLACSIFNPELFGSGSESDSSPQDTSSEESLAQATEEIAPAAEPTAKASGACNNIFYPLVPGQQMIYKTTSPEGDIKTGMTVSKVEGNFATLDMLNMATGIVSQTTVECEDGAIKNSPAVSMGTIMDDLFNGALDIKYVSGYIAPNEETLVANDWQMTWESHYIMNGELTITEDGETVTILIEDSPVVMKWETVATGQSITVEAGTYENTVKVTRDMTMEITINTNGMKIASTLLIETTHWFEPYIGQVKMDIDEVSIQMQGMTFPMDVSETMELVEFRPAK